MKTYKSSLIIITALASMANFWIWRIAKVDLVFASALLVLSLLLSFTLINSSRRIWVIFLLLLILMAIRILSTGFDNNFKALNPDQQKRLNQRHEYYSNDLGIIFQNKIVLRFYKDVMPHINIYVGNIFNSLSPNLYFFTNHPREREKVEEFLFYPSFFVTFFLIGLITFLNNIRFLVFGYLVFSLLITGFIKQDYLFGPIMFFPVVNLLIGIGFLKIYHLFRS